MALERMQLGGKVALVTGGAKGIGYGIGSTLAEAGATVVIMARTPGDVDAAVARIVRAGGQARGVAGDVLKRPDLERLVQAGLDVNGGIDIVVNNAGGTQLTPFADVTASRFLEDFHFNVVQAFDLIQLAVPHMGKHGEGSIVNISSRAAELGGANLLTYSVAKAGLEQLTRFLSLELAPDIRVNAIGVGMTATEGLEGYLASQEGARERVLPQIPLHRIGDPEGIGLAVLYLCSDQCYATGHVLNVDGGIEISPVLG